MSQWCSDFHCCPPPPSVSSPVPSSECSSPHTEPAFWLPVEPRPEMRKMFDNFLTGRDQAAYLSVHFYMGYLDIKTTAWIIGVCAAPVLIDQSIGRHSSSQVGGETRTETGYILPAKSKRGKNYLISPQLTGWEGPDGRIKLLICRDFFVNSRLDD